MAKRNDFSGVIIGGLVMVIFVIVITKYFTPQNVTKVEDALNAHLPIDLNSSADSLANSIKRWFGTDPTPSSQPSLSAVSDVASVATSTYIGPYSPEWYDAMTASYIGPYSPEYYADLYGSNPGSGS